jgi:Flp pilus assembly pilin Flp
MVYILTNPPQNIRYRNPFPGGRRSLPVPCAGIRITFLFIQEARIMHHLQTLWRDEEGQDIAEYAVMLAVILVIVVGTIRLIGSNANNVFSNVASSIQ